MAFQAVGVVSLADRDEIVVGLGVTRFGHLADDQAVAMKTLGALPAHIGVLGITGTRRPGRSLSAVVPFAPDQRERGQRNQGNQDEDWGQFHGAPPADSYGILRKTEGTRYRTQFPSPYQTLSDRQIRFKPEMLNF